MRILAAQRRGQDSGVQRRAGALQIVDTHAHIYHADEVRYPMLPDPLRPPEGTGTVEHLRRETEASGVARAVLVQTGSAYRWDNRVLGETSAANRPWCVGVCTLDPLSAESPGELAHLANHHNVRGIRMEATRSGEPAFHHAGSVRMWEAARDLGLVVCAHVRAAFLEELGELLAQFPDVQVVLDHAAYPRAEDGPDSETVRRVLELARFPQLHVKLTFVVTGSEAEYPFRDMHPVVRAIVAGYGPQRCMWGSDFPCELWLKKASYSEHLSVFTEELGFGPAEQEAILVETPTRLWFAA